MGVCLLMRLGGTSAWILMFLICASLCRSGFSSCPPLFFSRLVLDLFPHQTERILILYYFPYYRCLLFIYATLISRQRFDKAVYQLTAEDIAFWDIPFLAGSFAKFLHDRAIFSNFTSLTYRQEFMFPWHRIFTRVPSHAPFEPISYRSLK